MEGPFATLPVPVLFAGGLGLVVPVWVVRLDSGTPEKDLRG
ncbi:hypothetical protein SAMN05192558_1185 [Actinokineospora alba]|uniref:Uncharacterized protein n=1 Tax=Actinokineospora alba TaxID=504798 RepID=A0A1H0W5Q2_9PSEU|nr:hypothetical protein C8E96_5649 [Actinokineospora alba]SDJ49137.1 hypothetical protein SAMN05421871_1175 [Actinokineospora alba]SDP86064.1 hypothetical protein SAMN05192558_1185 [Actinokineospora alba]